MHMTNLLTILPSIIFSIISFIFKKSLFIFYMNFLSYTFTSLTVLSLLSACLAAYNMIFIPMLLLLS